MPKLYKIQCPVCKVDNKIDVIIEVVMSVSIEDGDGVWEWDAAEAIGNGMYRCSSCKRGWSDRMADDFVVEDK